jgi:hypothetical protein
MLRTTFILLLTLLFAGSAKAMTPSGRQAGDSTTGVPREVFYFSEAPKLWQQRPTISDLQGGLAPLGMRVRITGGRNEEGLC